MIIPRKPPFPIRDECKPGKTRFFAALFLFGLGAICYFTHWDAIFVAFSLVISAFPLWSLIRGPHFLFTLDDNGIAWSQDLKKKPLTRIPLANIREVHLTKPEDGESSEILLVIIDQDGLRTSSAGTAGPTARKLGKCSASFARTPSSVTTAPSSPHRDLRKSPTCSRSAAVRTPNLLVPSDSTLVPKRVPVIFLP